MGGPARCGRAVVGATSRGGDPDPVAYQAVCGCGWRSDREHPVPPRPTVVETDAQGRPCGAKWDAWWAAREAAEDRCWEDWTAEHFEPLLGYEPHTQLILARTDGGQRHFLDGRPVHAGARLELLLDDGRWVSVRYEWSWQPDEPPRAYLALGVPTPARAITDAPVVSFALPAPAILRWPSRDEPTCRPAGPATRFATRPASAPRWRATRAQARGASAGQRPVAAQTPAA